MSRKRPPKDPGPENQQEQSVILQLWTEHQVDQLLQTEFVDVIERKKQTEFGTMVQIALNRHMLSGLRRVQNSSAEAEEQDGPLDLSTPRKEERPHRCGFAGCIKSFKSKKNLTQHEKSHNAHEGVCNLCTPPKYFKYRDGLITHRKTQHEVPPYLCDECEEAYQTSTLLNDHRREKHSTCALCGGNYANAAGRKIHMKACRQMHDDSTTNTDSGYASRLSMNPKKSRHASRDSGISCGTSHDSGISCGTDGDTMPRSMIEESLPEVDESSMETKPNIVTKETTLMSQRQDDDEKMANFGITTACVALATFFSHGVQSIPPGMLDTMLQVGQSYREELGIGPETEHAAAVELISDHGKIENDEPYISVNFGLVEKPVFKGHLDNNERVLKAFDRFSGQFRWGIVALDGKYVAIELDVHASRDFYVFDPVGNGTLFQNDGVRKATIVRCPRDGLTVYLSNVFTGASAKEFTIIPVTITKITSPGRNRN